MACEKDGCAKPSAEKQGTANPHHSFNSQIVNYKRKKKPDDDDKQSNLF
jgi:hypothetical protein